MSLPTNLTETYLQYKVLTDRSIRWLFETARRLGYSLGDRYPRNSSPSNESMLPPRLAFYSTN